MCIVYCELNVHNSELNDNAPDDGYYSPLGTFIFTKIKTEKQKKKNTMTESLSVVTLGILLARRFSAHVCYFERLVVERAVAGGRHGGTRPTRLASPSHLLPLWHGGAVAVSGRRSP